MEVKKFSKRLLSVQCETIIPSPQINWIGFVLPTLQLVATLRPLHSLRSPRSHEILIIDAALRKKAYIRHLMALQQDEMPEEVIGAPAGRSESDDIEATPISSDPFPDFPSPTPTHRLYLMVLADFGLAFTWLCKYAVAT